MTKRKVPSGIEISPIGLSVDETAARMGCGRTTVYDLMKAGKLRYAKVKARRISTPEWIAECIASCEVKAT